MNKKSLAELCGIHAGDGYLRNDGRRIEWGINGRFFKHRNTYGFVVRDRGVIEKIHSFGFPYGNKTMTVSMPKFVFSSNKTIKSLFLRGLFDTDGCLTFDRKGTIYKK